MEIIGTIMLEDEPREYSGLLVERDGGIKLIEDAVQTETLLSVFVNEVLTVKLMCSKSNLVELVVGNLFAQSIIDSVDEISAVSICEQAMRADVLLHSHASKQRGKTVTVTPTCCTKNILVSDELVRKTDLEPVEPIPWTHDLIFRICDEFALDKTAHARTRGAHSAYLCSPDETLCIREDIGRHNAFDKAVGWALTNGVDLSKCLMYTSGRVPTDMVEKAIRARIPILVSKAVATDKTVEAARTFGLTLICEGKRGSFIVMNDPLRMMDCPMAKRPKTRTA